MTWSEAENLFSGLGSVCDVVRLVEPDTGRVVLMQKDGEAMPGHRYCHELFGRAGRCGSCIGKQACETGRADKFELSRGEIYHVSARPIEADGRLYWLETVSRVRDDALLAGLSRESLITAAVAGNSALYTDELTGAYNTAYFEDRYGSLPPVQAAALVEPDGDFSGKAAPMRETAELVRRRIRSSDTLIRLTDTRLLLLFDSISAEAFLRRMEDVRADVPLLSDGSLTVSIGGLYLAGGLGAGNMNELIEQLDKARRTGNRFAYSTPGIASSLPGFTPALGSLLTFSGDYHTIFSIDFATGGMEILQTSGEFSSWNKDAVGLGYEKFRRRFADSFILPADKALFLRETAPQAILEALEKDDAYYVTHCVLHGNAPHYFQSKFMKDARLPGPGRVLLGGRIVDSDVQRAAENSSYRERREIALHRCLNVLNAEQDSDTAIRELLATVLDYYGAERVYIDEITPEEDDILPVTHFSENSLTPGAIKELLGMDRLCLREWIASFRKNGEFFFDAAAPESEESAETQKILRQFGVSSIALAPLFLKDKLTGFLGLDNLTRSKDDLFLLRTVASFVYSELLRRRQEHRETEEHYALLASLADDFDFVAFADLVQNTTRIFRITPEFRKISEGKGWGASADYSYRRSMFADTFVAEEDRGRYLEAMATERILKELSASPVYYVNYTAVIEGRRYAYQTKLVRVNDRPGCILFGVRSMEAERQEERRLQEQLELTVAERTAELREKNAVLTQINEDVVEFTGTLIEARDSESGQHIRRIKGFTHILALQVMQDLPEYGLTKETAGLIASASALHDVGKIMIPDSILLKPDKLTPEEFSLMKTHCERGADILRQAPRGWSSDYLATALDIVLCHHEKADGNGYPRGLKGDEIPISAQIVSIADCYEALTAERVYKPAYSPDKAFEMIMNGECGAFSEKLLGCFTRCRCAFEKHYRDGYAPSALPLYASNVLKGTVILLVERDSPSHGLTKNILTEEGVLVLEARTAEEALDVLGGEKAASLDAVLIDLSRTASDVERVIRAIRSAGTPHFHSLPVIGLLAGYYPDYMEPLRKMGITSFLGRPFSVISLTRVLLECMRRRSAMPESLTDGTETAPLLLPGIQTAAAYTAMVQRLTARLLSGDAPSFALVCADINNLQEVNTRFGHSTGDEFIRNCCAVLTDTFTDSPVYRIGGDEFVVVLAGEKYAARNALMERLCERATAAMHLPDVTSGRASLAAGVAAFDPALDRSVSSVYERAEVSMLRNKALMHP